MSDTSFPRDGESAPGDDSDSFISGFTTYAIGLILALGLTATSFVVSHSHLFWGPGIPVGLMVLAVAQIWVHLVFFLHITTGPDNTNNVLALTFGIIIVFLVVAGSLWIMGNLNHMMPSMQQMMNMQT